MVIGEAYPFLLKIIWLLLPRPGKRVVWRPLSKNHPMSARPPSKNHLDILPVAKGRHPDDGSIRSQQQRNAVLRKNVDSFPRGHALKPGRKLVVYVF